MTKKSPTIIFFGTENYSLITLKKLVENDYNIAAVVTKPDTKRGRGHKITAPAVKTFALQNNIPVWQPQKLTEITDQIKLLQPVCGILVAYGKIIPLEIIHLFTPAIINIHPSLLPLWRGPSPVESSIINHDKITGVSLMQLDKEMDSGDIYIQQKLKLHGNETKPELYNQLFEIGSQLLIDNLEKITSKTIQQTPQNQQNATYCPLLSKNLSLIEPSKMQSIDIMAHIRAYLDFPRTTVVINDLKIIILAAHIDSSQTSPLSLPTKDGKYLTIYKLIAPSGKTMLASDFVRGYMKIN